MEDRNNMKGLRSIWLLFVAATLTCCTNPPFVERFPETSPQHPKLAAIDTLMQTRPDSALVLLLDDPMDDPYYHLLLSEALYKNDYAQANHQELLSAVTYFDSLNTDPFLSARAHYIKGVGYYEQDSVVPACAEYLKALEIMEEHFSEKEIIGHKAKSMAYIYNRLGDLFSEQFMMESSISCYKNALKHCIIEPTSPNGISNILFRIGKQYDKKNEAHKARKYFEKAIKEIKCTDNLLYRDIVSSKAIADYQLGLDLEDVLNELRQVLLHANDDKERSNRFLTIGAIFMQEQINDSALFYLVPVFQDKSDVVSQILAAESLRIIYNRIGMIEKADECARFLADHKKPEGENKALVSRLEDLFQNHLYERQKTLAKKEQNKTTQKVIWIIIPLGLTIAIFLAYLTRINGRKKLKKHQLETESILEEKHRQLEKEKKARQRDKEKHQQDLRQKEEQLLILERALDHKRTETEQRRDAFLKEDICCKITDDIRSQHITARNCSYKKVTFTDEDAEALRKAVLKHYGNIESLLLSKYPKMSKDDLLLCQLYLLGLDERQIAVVLCKSYSTVKKRADSLRKKMRINDSLSSYILSF